MLRVLLTLSALLCIAGCGPRYTDYFPYHDDGRSKPAVALLPVVDATGLSFPWNNAQLVTERIRYDIMDSGELYLLPREEIDACVETFPPPALLLENSEQLALQFPDADFIASLELLRIECTPFQEAEHTPTCVVIEYPCTDLMRAYVRIRVIDLRPRSAKLVLQEIVTHSFLLPFEIDPRNCESSPVWKAQHRLADRIVNRLEQVIQCAY
jgi:hypothetical protein